MAGYNPSGGDEPNGLQNMFARLQAARTAQNQDSAAAHNLLSRLTYNQGNNQPYYGQPTADSPLTALDDYPPPAAPTPPSNLGHSHHAHHPPGLSNLGPIGTMNSNSTTNPDQSANLLNLLKFSGGGQTQNSQSIPQSIPQSSPPVHTHDPSFDHFNNVPHTSNPPIHAPVPMPADPRGVLATLMHEEGAQAEPQHTDSHGHGHRDSWNDPPSAHTTNYLLDLLQRPKPAQNDQPSANEPSHPATLTPQSANGSASGFPKDYSQLKQVLSEHPSHHSTPQAYQFGSKEQAESPSAKFVYTSPTSQHAQHESMGGSRKASTRFDYTNPFDQFSKSSPQNRASEYSTQGTFVSAAAMPTELPAATAIKIAKKNPSATSSPGFINDQKRLGSERSPIASPEHVRRKIEGSPNFGTDSIRNLSPMAASTPADAVHDKNKETVSEAMSDLAEKANVEAQEALERAEQEEVQAKIARDLENMMRAKTDAEFQESAEAAAKDIKKELDKDEYAGALENEYSPEVAQVIRDIVDGAAHGPVADSWESADADEIVVIEEGPNPVKVYGFPMKPWISITMLETDEPRPQFRDEVILDIARLKKDFDQIDRNLVTATELYMVYGMSKAGGLRVIRQDDGKDAKLFTDTKDRIFNVAMSSTPSDLSTMSALSSTPKESIIGTGISGTVYYVLIKDGDKDHLEDAHPEQYGFALPPISAQEGDAPGGVLKTRARTSSVHPEYFAVGRGKTISIIWPSYVMQKNLFKPGHDRVVDTERLAKECALRINTGKAGKDFTFSQDDTTIVSLDKSGRVKFWDVRDLTAADENSDSRFPVPAHTSLEVKEPLMTLNTTPEGEKAWPTSVLLLDKQRPYQKRCALRYMIVGMKQNHTLQLWDLALGKPVQEFNLPHTKESDAVCSVMYHAASGMIVVGHPTRNSIYFLHLSAPKYTIKGLSQVDYIQKLVAKDSSIPEPDSTAVISGVREYSFANKGGLRSLDILGTPSPVNPAPPSDTEEQTLFELYAMHSKGVTGIWVKQSELGWTKDNKVINGVDATDVGLVKIAKLKELPSTLVSELPPAEESTTLPIRIAARSSQKDTPPPQASLSSGQDQSRKGAENIPPSSLQPERKEGDVPVTPVNQLDKSEKKARKKREKAAAAAAAAAERLAVENTQSNGSSQSPRVDPVSSKNTEFKVNGASQPTMSAESIQSAVKQISSGLNEKLVGILANEFKNQRGKVEAEFRAREDTFAKSQKDLLDLVSKKLNENVQAVLTRTISDQFDENVVPHLSALVTKTIENQFDAKIGGKISHSVQNQMQKLLPNAISQALQRPELSKAISDKVVSSVAIDMEHSFRQTLMTTITPIFSEMTIAAAKSVVNDVQLQTASQIEEFGQRHVADIKKIDQLTALVADLSSTVSTMAASQAKFQEGFLKLQQHISRDRVSAPSAPQSQPAQSVQTQTMSYGSPAASSGNQMVPFPGNGSSVKDAELQHMIANVASFMERGEYETGLVRWIQLPRRHELFDEYIVQYAPQIMQGMPALVLLSVASVIAEQLTPENHLLMQRVNWVDAILSSLLDSLPHITDGQVRDVVPKIMTNFHERIEKLFIHISSHSPTDAMLPRLSAMNHMATRISEIARHQGY